MEVLGKHEGIVYSVLTYSDIDRLYIQGFEFFRTMGVSDYRLIFRIWCSKPSIYSASLYGAVAQDKELVGWCYIDIFEGGSAKDTTLIHIIRGIEIKPQWQGKGIAGRLLAISTKDIMGYVFVKPITPRAKEFWEHFGFKHGGIEDIMAEYDTRYAKYLYINGVGLRKIYEKYWLS